MICRIDLTKTNYKQIDFTLLGVEDFPRCEAIYKKYIDHNEIENPHPVFEEEWSLTYRFPSKQTVIADQFAWDYKDPSLKLGYKSIRSECAYYKALGFKYFILGDPDKYKQEIKGYEIIERNSDGVFST